jgi:hypothetical protein
VDEHTGEARVIHPRWTAMIWRDNQFQASTWVIRADVWRSVRCDESLYYADDWCFAMRVEQAVGWEFYGGEPTGSATCWPGGLSDRDAAGEERFRRDRRFVIRSARSIRHGRARLRGAA